MPCNHFFFFYEYGTRTSLAGWIAIIHIIHLTDRIHCFIAAQFFASLFLIPNLAKHVFDTISRLLSSSSVDWNGGVFYPRFHPSSHATVSRVSSLDSLQLFTIFFF
jgi:hypothetical protein